MRRLVWFIAGIYVYLWQQLKPHTVNRLRNILSHFVLSGTVSDISPLGNGLVNDTYRVTTAEPSAPDYVLQRINHAIFRDVARLQANIEAVTRHIRHKLEQQGADDIDRKVLRFLPTDEGLTYWQDEEGRYWRVMVFIPRARTVETVNPVYSEFAGEAFGRFQSMLADLPDRLEETIPHFHDMEFRLRQLQEAVSADPAHRLAEVRPLVDALMERAESMCLAERLHREGVLPKRICHCDTKVNNMMFDEEGRVLCVIDLDTVMPSYIFSDYGDFLRTAANVGREDDPHPEKVSFDMEIFRAFTRGYLRGAGEFLLPVEREHLPYAAMLFPYMQAVRFLTDYLNGDVYYKTAYPDHNLVRTRAQLQLLRSVEQHQAEMKAFVESFSH